MAKMKAAAIALLTMAGLAACDGNSTGSEGRVIRGVYSYLPTVNAALEPRFHFRACGGTKLASWSGVRLFDRTGALAAANAAAVQHGRVGVLLEVYNARSPLTAHVAAQRGDIPAYVVREVLSVDTSSPSC